MTQSQNAQKRIVVTGLGVACGAGCSIDDFWTSLTQNPEAPSSASSNGKSSEDTDTAVTGTFRDFGTLPDRQRKQIRKSLKLMNRETHLGVAAGQQAITDSGAVDAYQADRFGVCFGADNVAMMPDDFERGIQACSSSDGQFGPERWGEDGIDEMAPLWILKCLPNMPGCHLAILNNLQGPSNTITQRDVSANMAIGEACRSLRSGDADAMIVGATGTTLSAFAQLHAQLEDEIDSTDAICRPFDRRRTGPAPGEGAGAIVLEEREAARRRGARIYGEILSTSAATSINSDGRANCRIALARAVRLSMQRAGRVPESIGHIHAHGLSTWNSDIAEAQALRDVFGDECDAVPVVAAKGHLANSASGAGMLELIASLLAMKHGHLFPIRNFSEPDPACPIRPVVNGDEPAGASFLNLSMFGRGLASCTTVCSDAA